MVKYCLEFGNICNETQIIKKKGFILELLDNEMTKYFMAIEAQYW